MTKLNQTVVIRAALELLNEVGMDNLTTRKLAERLGVQQPALYWYFKSKQALLDKLAEEILSEKHVYSLPRHDDDWRSFLIGNACSFRQALLAYRDGARIHAGTQPNEPQFHVAEAQLKFLCERGFSAVDATYALLIISHYTVGSVLEEQTKKSNEQETATNKPDSALLSTPYLMDALKKLESDAPDTAFEFGLMVIIDGLDRRRSH